MPWFRIRRDEGGGASSTQIITQAVSGTCQLAWAVAHPVPSWAGEKAL